MAISILGTPTAVADGGSYTAESGSNRLVVWAFFAFVAGGVRTVSSCTFGGVSMTSAGSQVVTAASTYLHLNIYYLKEADIPSGSQVLDVTWNSSITMQGAYAFTLGGVDQTTPVRSSDGRDGPASTSLASNGFSVSDGDLAFGQGEIRNNKALSVSGYTEHFDTFSGARIAVYSKTISGSGTETPTLAWDGTTQDAIIKFVSFAAASSPSGLTITSVNTTNTAFSAQTDSSLVGTGLSASVVCTYAGIACANESASSSTSLKITFPNFFTNNIKLGRDYEFKVVG